MKFAVVGLTHKDTPIAIRERASFSETKKIEATSILRQKGLQEFVILSTCNRSEIYIASSEPESSCRMAADFFCEYFGSEEIRAHLITRRGKEAIEYLYQVCSGLDSLILGEDQILGQVKDALMTAMELGSTSKYINKLFREAITTAKAIKTRYKISENPLSVSYIGVKFLKEQIEDLKNKKVVVVGTGKMGMLAINHLIAEGVTDICCCNRNAEKLKELIGKYPFIRHRDYAERYEMIEQADILISATSSTHQVINAGYVKERTKPLFAMDLALPRDIDAEIGRDEMIQLYDIDSLKEVSESNEALREEIARKAKGMIDESIEEFGKWARTAKADPTIQSLNERCYEIKRDTLSYLYRKIDLNTREQKILDKMLESALRRLIQKPIVTLKETEEDTKREEYIRVLDELFELR